MKKRKGDQDAPLTLEALLPSLPRELRRVSTGEPAELDVDMRMLRSRRQLLRMRWADLQDAAGLSNEELALLRCDGRASPVTIKKLGFALVYMELHEFVDHRPPDDIPGLRQPKVASKRGKEKLWERAACKKDPKFVRVDMAALEHCRLWCEDRRRSWGEVADYCDISVEDLVRLQTEGKAAADTLIRIAEFFGVTAEALLGDGEEERGVAVEG